MSPGLLHGKCVLVTGLLTESSIAFHVARLAQLEGAEVVLTSFGRQARLTAAFARRLPAPAPVVQLDVTSASDLEGLRAAVLQYTDTIDGVLHAIAHAPPAALGHGLLDTEWPDVASTLRVSAYSLPALASAVLPILNPGSCIVGLTFDSSRAWPGYDWMGVAKGALESTCQYLARDLSARGVRINLVAAGPLRTLAGAAIPGFDPFARAWSDRAPLGWDPYEAEPAARACVALLSDWFPATTGAVLHVDGGAHSLG